MARLLVFLYILFPGSLILRAETTCAIAAQTRAAATANRLVYQLRHIKVADMDDGFPSGSGPLTQQLKDALSASAISVLACTDTTASLPSIQTHLAALLHANLPPAKDESATDANPNEPVENVFATNLEIRVSSASDSPQLLAVQFTFAISCGEDNVLVLFHPSDHHWKPVLLWQAQNIADIGKAFGDFFLWKILPGPSPQQWRLVAAHGKPWCTSRFSGFAIDILAPTPDLNHPRLVWHTDRLYSRSDFTPTLKANGNTFDLRVNADAMSFDIDSAFERRVIYTYRVTGDHVERLQPIAFNARGFVEEWLSMPWAEAATEIIDPASVQLKSLHTDYEKQVQLTGNSFIENHYGPVLACKPNREFQVEMKASRETMVPNKPGGDSAPLPSTFYRVRDTGNGYILLSATPQSDSQCTGPNLMHDQQ